MNFEKIKNIFPNFLKNFFKDFTLKKAFIFSLVWLIFAIIWNFTIAKEINLSNGQGWAASDAVADRWVFLVDMRWQYFTTNDLNPYLGKFTEAYLPLVYLIFNFLPSLINFHTEIMINPTVYKILFLYLFVFTLAFIFVLKKIKINFCQKVYIFLITFSSYPLIFMIFRGNIDLLLISFFLLFCFYRTTNLGVFFLGFCICIKPQFGVFIFYYLFRNEWKQFILLSILVSIVSLISFNFLYGGIIENLKGLLTNLFLDNKGKEVLGYQNLGLRYSHSFTNIIKFIFYHTGLDFDSKVPQNFSDKATIIFLIYFLYFSFKNLRDNEHILILILTLFTCFVPFYSFDYKLLFILLVHILIFKKLDHYLNWLLVILYIPKNHHFYSIPEFIHPQIAYGSFVNPIIFLIIFLYINLKYRKNKI